MLIPHIAAASSGAEKLPGPVTHSAFRKGDEETQAVLTPRELCCALRWGCIKARSFSTCCLSRHPKIQGAGSSPASASAEGDGSTPGTSTARGRWGEHCCPARAGRSAAVSSGTPSQDFPQEYVPVLLSCLMLSDKPPRKSRAHRCQSSVFLLLFSVL